MARLPSLRAIFETSWRTLRRFPMALAAALLAGISAVLLVDSPGDEELLYRLLMTGTLGIPLFLALAVFGERREQAQGSRLISVLLHLGGLVFLLLYYFSLPEHPRSTTFLRFAQFDIGLHLLVAILPFLARGEDNAFWQYNKTLFLRLIAAVLFSFTLFFGLAIALLALDKLFGVAIADEVYPRLFILIAFIFNTWYFAGGIPERIAELEEVEDYPAIIKVFAQYILAPLVFVYLALLSVYLFKVMFTREWPSGWIGYLVSSVAAAGILSLALLYPLLHREGNQWIRIYRRVFYILLLPAIGMLFMAIFKRIDQYGITEPRYLLTLLAAWLAAVALYALFSRRKSLKLIPLTLCLIAFASSCGPWGAYSVSRRSQTGRLESLLASNQRLQAGLIAAHPATVSTMDRREISAGLDYLNEAHGPWTLEDWYDEALREQVVDWEFEQIHHENSRDLSRLIMAYMNCAYMAQGNRLDGVPLHFSLSPEDRVLPVAGFDYACEIQLVSDAGQDLVIGGIPVAIRLDPEGPVLRLSSPEGPDLALPLEDTLVKLRDDSSTPGPHPYAPRELLSLEADDEARRVRIVLESIGAKEAPGGFEVHHLAGTLLIRFNP